MTLARRLAALGLALALALAGAAWLAARWTRPDEVVAALQPAAVEAAPAREAELLRAASPTRRASGPERELDPATARVPVEPEVPASRPRGSFFDLRGLGTLTGVVEVRAAARWARAPEDSNLRLRIAPTTRIPEFEMSGIFRGQLPLRTMTALGERDGARRWSFDAGSLPCGDYTLTLLPVGAETQVTIRRGSTSDALVALPPLERVELAVLEDGAPYPAEAASFSPWAAGGADAAPDASRFAGGRRPSQVAAAAGPAVGTFTLYASPGLRAVTLDLGPLGELRRDVRLPAGGGRVTVEVTRRYAVELHVEDEYGRPLRPRWSADARVVAGGAELQSRRSLPRDEPSADSQRGARTTADLLLDGRGSLLAATDEPVALPGPASIWYFTGPGTVELTVEPPAGWGEAAPIVVPIGVDVPSRATVRVARPEPRTKTRYVELGRGGLGLGRAGAR